MKTIKELEDRIKSMEVGLRKRNHSDNKNAGGTGPGQQHQEGGQGYVISILILSLFFFPLHKLDG